MTLQKSILLCLTISILTSCVNDSFYEYFENGDYKLELKNCDYGIPSKLHNGLLLEKKLNQILLHSLGYCPQKGMTINSTIKVDISKDTIKLFINQKQEQVWYPTFDNSLTTCTCYNIQTFNFNSSIDTSKAVSINYNNLRPIVID